MKAILVPVEQYGFMRSVLDAALLMAGRFGSHIEGLALGPDIPDIVAFDVPVGWTLLSEKEQRELIERSRQLFEEFMTSCAVPRAVAAAPGRFVGGTLSVVARIGADDSEGHWQKVGRK